SGADAMVPRRAPCTMQRNKHDQQNCATARRVRNSGSCPQRRSRSSSSAVRAVQEIRKNVLSAAWREATDDTKSSPALNWRRCRRGRRSTLPRQSQVPSGRCVGWAGEATYIEWAARGAGRKSTRAPGQIGSARSLNDPAQEPEPGVSLGVFLSFWGYQPGNSLVDRITSAAPWIPPPLHSFQRLSES